MWPPVARKTTSNSTPARVDAPEEADGGCHQGRSLRSGLAQSLEDQHSSVDLVITVDHASRAPVCGVGLGRLAGVLGESVRPQPFARLAGLDTEDSLLIVECRINTNTRAPTAAPEDDRGEKA